MKRWWRFAPDVVVSELRGRSVSEAIKELADALGGHRLVADTGLLADDILYREGLRSTSLLGGHVAVPHAVTGAVRGPVLAYGRSLGGISRASDGALIHQVFLIAVPPEKKELLWKLLNKALRLIRSSSIPERLQKCPDTQTINQTFLSYNRLGIETLMFRLFHPNGVK